jgi:hypothetical protein
LLSFVTFFALAAVALLVLFRSLGPPDDASAPGPMGSAPPASPSAAAPAGPEIRGTITISPGLARKVGDGSVLFIIARKGAGPPFAVKRIVSPRFPLTYRIGSEDVMLAGSPFDGEVRMSARVSRTGSAGPPQAGDLEGERLDSVRVGQHDADIAISRQR